MNHGIAARIHKIEDSTNSLTERLAGRREASVRDWKADEFNSTSSAQISFFGQTTDKIYGMSLFLDRNKHLGFDLDGGKPEPRSMAIKQRSAGASRRRFATIALAALTAWLANLSACAQSPDQQPTSSAWLDVYKRAFLAYNDGHANEAIQLAEEAYALRPKTDDDTALSIAENLQTICFGAGNLSCVHRYAARISELTGRLINSGSKTPEQKRALAVEGAERVLRELNLAGNSTDTTKLISILGSAEIPKGGFVDYVHTELALAHAAVGQRDLTAAANYTERAWIYFLASRDRNERDFVDEISDFLNLFGVTQQPAKAFTALAIGGPTLDRLAEHYRYQQFNLLVAKHGVLIDANEIDLAIAAAKQAISLLDHLDFDPVEKRWKRTQLLSSLEIDCSLTGSGNCMPPENDAELANDLAWLRSFRLDENVSNQLATVGTALTMHAALSHTPLPESTTRNLLQLDAVAPTSDMIASDTRQSLLMIQRFFMAVAANDPRADEYVIKAAASELSRMKLAVAQAPFNVTPINLYTRVAFGIAAISLAGRSSRSASQSEMLFELAANLNRSQKNIESQYLYLLAQADTSVEMATFQALYRTEQSLDRLERETFAQRVSSFRGGLAAAPTSNLDSRIWGELQQLILLRAKYSKAQVRAGEILGRSTNLLAATYGSLRPDERFVTNLAFVGKFARICVDRNSLSASISTFDAPTEQARLSRIHRALTAPIGLPNDDKFPVEDTKQLSLLLLGSDDHCLGNAQQVVFAPPLDFTSLPMATLIDPAPSGTSSTVQPGSAQINWLGANRGITIVSDPQQFLAARRLRHSSEYPLPFLGIGDPRFGGKTSDGQSRAEVALRGSSNGALRLADLGEANQLPDTATELKQVAARFGANSEILLGERSREMDFREKLLENYRVISFATHGLLREEIVGLPEPALLLTPSDSRAVENDGLLTTTEIGNLDIPADLVILSACNSANFDLRSFAPEVASLSTAFFLAGAHSTLASLWSVNSEATERLMVLFADEYVAKPAPGAAIALRNAIRRFLNSGSSQHFQDPRFWAAFSVYGDGGPLDDAPERRVMPGHLVQTDLAGDYGEALALTHNRAGTVVAGYVADGGSRVVGSLQQLDEAGQIVWGLKDREHSFVLQRGDTVGATSALAWSVSANQPSELIFESFDTTGTLVTQQPIPSESNEVPLSLQVISENEFVVGTKISGRGGYEDYLIRTLDSRGSTKSLRKFEVGPLHSDPAAMTIVNTGNGIWVGISEADPTRKPIVRVNEFGVRESCIAPTVTSLHHLDHNLEDSEPPLHILDAVVKDAVALPNERVAFALMKYDACSTVDVSSAVSIWNAGTLSGLIPIELPGFSNRPHRIGLGPAGDIIVVGSVTDATDYFHPVDQALFSSSHPEDKIRTMSPSRKAGIFFVKLNEDMKSQNDQLFFSGTDLWLNDVQAAGDAWAIAGSDGYRPFLGRINKGAERKQ